MRKISSLIIEDAESYLSCMGEGYVYLGDPVNTIGILSNASIDEVIVLDIGARKNGINLALLNAIRRTADYPIGYGGGIYSTEDAAKIFNCGIDRIYQSGDLWSDSVSMNIVDNYGKQALGASILIRRNLGQIEVVHKEGRKRGRAEKLDSMNNIYSLCSDIVLCDIDHCGMTKPDIAMFNDITKEILKTSGAENTNLIVGGGFALEDHDKDTKELSTDISGIVYSRTIYMQSSKMNSILISGKNV